jgi:hypothetical protein
MRTKEIILNLRPSKLPLITIILMFILAIIVMNYLPGLKIWTWFFITIISTYWLYKYLTYPYYQIYINTNSSDIQIRKTGSLYTAPAYTANLTQVKSITWWLTIVKLTVMVDQKIRKKFIPIFMDSTPLKKYKLLRMFTLWQ